jgi:ppGpp synthetase/RelA/SpoT-type nucleotidyltranferase
VSNGKPTNIRDYRAWLKRQGADVSNRTATRYGAVVAKIRADFEASPFWVDVGKRLVDLDAEYRLQDNYPLLMTTDLPTVVLKPYTSLLNKSFRRNCLENENWPDPPAAGWLLPDTWYSRTNDLVRTTFVVKYLDGVAFLGDELASVAKEHGLESELTLESRMEGYYAGHLVTQHEIEIPREDWDTEKIVARVEIQITTQLQDVIRRMLHRYYADARAVPESPQWEWNYQSDEFVANYLGHILHYVEGMIMEVRQRQRGQAPTGPDA